MGSSDKSHHQPVLAYIFIYIRIDVWIRDVSAPRLDFYVGQVISFYSSTSSSSSSSFSKSYTCTKCVPMLIIKLKLESRPNLLSLFQRITLLHPYLAYHSPSYVLFHRFLSFLTYFLNYSTVFNWLDRFFKKFA